MHQLLRLLFCCLFFCIPFFFTATESEVPTGADVLNRLYNVRTIRLPVWVFNEAPPEADPLVWKNSLDRLFATAQYIMEASVFGWHISYTPYDRSRSVAEYFESKPVFPLPESAISLEAVIEDGAYLKGIAVYEMLPDRVRWYDQWENAKYKTFNGSGEGALEDGIQGLHLAVELAVKEAVRSYGRSIEKNKPKEIKALVRLAGNPRIIIKAGHFVADLKVRMVIEEIVPYSVY